jgi:uncharacterized membrane protein (UPF0127 family)
MTLTTVDSDGKLVLNLTRGSVVCDDVVIADRAGRRMRGLLGRDSLAPGEGMLLQPAPSIHTVFMRFSIDAVFMDGTLRVKKTVEGLRPWRVASARHAWGVLELAEGEVTRRGIGLGDQLGVVEVTDQLGAFVASSEWTGDYDPRPDVEVSADRVVDYRLCNQSGATSGEHGNPVDGTRVLVVGADRRFRSVAAALLTRRGCVVTLAERMTKVAEVAKLEASEVVVLDAGVSLTEAAHAAAQIEMLDRPVGIVIVGEEAQPSISAMPVLSKWGSFDGLYGAIEHARPSRARRSLNVLRG